MTHTVGYARVSSVDQNLDRQHESLNQYKLDKVYSDKASGKDIHREGFQQMLGYIRTGDTVVVKSLDRLGRSTLDILALVQQWADDGIGLTIIDDNALSFPAGGKLSPSQKMILTVMASVAEMERSLIKERQREGIALAKAAGKYKGRKSQQTVTPEQAKAVLAEHGGNKMQAAKSLGVNRTTFYRLIA